VVTLYSTLGPVIAWMGDRLWAGELSRYVTSQPGQFSLAIPLWVGTMSTSLGLGLVFLASQTSYEELPKPVY